MSRINWLKAGLVLSILGVPILLLASGTASESPHLPGNELSVLWVVPFIGILLSIAVLPLVIPRFWHHNFGKVSMFWALVLIVPLTLMLGPDVALYEILHVSLLDYIPFIILLLALFTISGGIRLKGSLVGTPVLNTIIIFIGTVLASWMGTTGAAMLLIRPLIRANTWRKHQVHVIVFFIFLVANIGGALTPLGDPPLFLGFLKGVDFFWTTTAMLKPMVFIVSILLVIFFILDTVFYRREDVSDRPAAGPEKITLEGSVNFMFLAGVVGAVLLSGFWKPGISISIYHVPIHLQNFYRDMILLAMTLLSIRYTPADIRTKNQFSWFPIQEVAKLFAGIFITIIPAIAILKAGTDGAMAPIISTLFHEGSPINAAFFWRTGILSSFLDNAPTYLVFFNAAGGDAAHLMTDYYHTLEAISAGAVFMGANTYIGNAPNFMVKSISEEAGIKMPSFFGYMAKYSLPILIPVFILVTLVFF